MGSRSKHREHCWVESPHQLVGKVIPWRKRFEVCQLYNREKDCPLGKQKSRVLIWDLCEGLGMDTESCKPQLLWRLHLYLWFYWRDVNWQGC